MAIQSSFNLSNALDSQAYAYKCWYNYNYGNNTMGISAQDMGEITQAWNSELNNWHATAMDDENAYEIEDDDFSTAKQNGENQAKDATGYDGKQGGQVTRTVVDAGLSVAGTAANVVGVKIAGNAVAGVAKNAVTSSAARVGAEKGAEAGTKTASKAGNVGWIVAAPLSLATGTAYTAKKPNKEQKEACDDLQDEMTNSQNALYSAQDEMSTAGDEITALSDEAQTYNEDANETIEENKTEYDSYKASYDAIKAKIDAGETLTDSEKELFQELVPIMQELGLNIQTTQEETTEVAADIYDEMGTYQENYDLAAETVGEVEGVTDYAESFDESTRTMCYVEAGSQTLNAASGTKAAYQAGSFAASGGMFTAWAWGFAAMGAAGAAMSGIGAAQQFKWAGEVGTEIDMREMTQDINSETSDIYDESIEGYEGAMVGVEEFELAMPKDMENPEETLQQLSEESGEAITKITVKGEEDGGTGMGTGLGAGIPTNNQNSRSTTGSGLAAGISTNNQNNGTTSGAQTAGGFGTATGGTRSTGGTGTAGQTGTTGGVNPNEKDKEEKQ